MTRHAEPVANAPGAGNDEWLLSMASRVSILAGSLMALVAVSPLLQLPKAIISLRFLGTPLSLEATQQAVVALLGGLLGWVGAREVLIEHPAYEPGARIYTHRVLPALAGAAALTLWQRQNFSLEARFALGACLALSFCLVLLGQYIALDEHTSGASWARSAMHALALLTAYYLWAVIYETRARSSVTASTSAVLGLLVAMDALQYDARDEETLWLFAAVAGLIIGECAWALNYWKASAPQAAAVLASGAYAMVALAKCHLRRSLNSAAVLEHVALALTMLVAGMVAFA
mgnify:FL=1